MVNIAKLAGFAGKLLQKPAALAVGTGIVGLTVGLSLGKCTGDAEVGDSFEKKPKTELKTDSTNVTKPEAKEEKPKFEYKPPKIGENGIVKTDTAYYENTGNIARIMYLDEKDKLVHQQRLNQDGTLKDFTCQYNGLDGSIEARTYDNKGNLSADYAKDKNGNEVHSAKTEEGNWLECRYDSKGRIVQQDYQYVYDMTSGKPYYTTAKRYYTYHPDGSYSEKDSRYDTQITYDKNDRVIKEKRYDGNNQLKYTVIPKYNKEGDIVKRDTIRNE